MTQCQSLLACCWYLTTILYCTMQNKGLIFQIVYFPVQYLTVFTTCTHVHNNNIIVNLYTANRNTGNHGSHGAECSVWKHIVNSGIGSNTSYFSLDSASGVQMYCRDTLAGRYIHWVHRVVTAAVWRTFHHEGKISQYWWGWGVHTHAPPFTTFTITSKVAVYAPVEWADTLTLFHL